jgi:hypothetical protein
MKKSFYQSRLLSLSVVASLVILFAGCGKTEDAGSGDGTGTGTSIPVVVGPGPGTPGNIGGCYTTSGVYACPLDLTAYTGTSSGFGRVSPTGSNGGFLPSVSPYVMPGDRIVFQGSGSYDDSGTFFQFCTGSNDYSLDGYSGSTPKTLGFQPYDNTIAVPRGLLARVGDHYYLLGSYANLTVTSSGPMTVGFNSSHVNGCYDLNVFKFVHIYCLDGNGYRTTCPNNMSLPVI